MPRVASPVGNVGRQIAQSREQQGLPLGGIHAALELEQEAGDLPATVLPAHEPAARYGNVVEEGLAHLLLAVGEGEWTTADPRTVGIDQIGRASCRERV